MIDIIIYIVIYTSLLSILFCYYNKKRKTLKIYPIQNNIKKTKSFTDINISNTYQKMYSIIPKNSKSINYLEELIKNNPINKSKKKCCNPDCKRKIYNTIFFAFDGSYCSINCRDQACFYIMDYWNDI